MSPFLHLQLCVVRQQRSRIDVSSDPIVDRKQALPFACGAERRAQQDAVTIEETAALAHLKIGDADGLRRRAQIKLEAERFADLKRQTCDLRPLLIMCAWCRRRSWGWCCRRCRLGSDLCGRRQIDHLVAR